MSGRVRVQRSAQGKQEAVKAMTKNGIRRILSAAALVGLGVYACSEPPEGGNPQVVLPGAPGGVGGMPMAAGAAGMAGMAGMGMAGGGAGGMPMDAAGAGGMPMAGAAGMGMAGAAGMAMDPPLPVDLRGPGNPPPLGDQLDRAGRPAISTALIETFNPDPEAQREEKARFNSAPPGVGLFEDTIKASLGVLDGLDRECGNQLLAGDGADRYDPLAELLFDDQLYVNSDRGECVAAYLGVEAETVRILNAEQEEGSCGGRLPNEDVVERSYSVLAAGALGGIDDGIVADDAVHDEDVFPFLAPPQ